MYLYDIIVVISDLDHNKRVQYTKVVTSLS